MIVRAVDCRRPPKNWGVERLLRALDPKLVEPVDIQSVGRVRGETDLSAFGLGVHVNPQAVDQERSVLGRLPNGNYIYATKGFYAVDDWIPLRLSEIEPRGAPATHIGRVPAAPPGEVVRNFTLRISEYDGSLGWCAGAYEGGRAIDQSEKAMKDPCTPAKRMLSDWIVGLCRLPAPVRRLRGHR